jgi:hypothetical protein
MLHEPKPYPSSTECHFATYNPKQATQLTSWNRTPFQRLIVTHILMNSKGHYYVHWSLFWAKHATDPCLGRNMPPIPILTEICHWFLSWLKYATDSCPDRNMPLIPVLTEMCHCFLSWLKYATAPFLGRNMSLIPIQTEICYKIYNV